MSFSIGLVEHFDCAVTFDLLRYQGGCSPFVLAALPSKYTKSTGPITDERLYRRREVNGLVRRAGVGVRESFVYGDVLTALARNLERLLPGVIYRRVKHVCTYGMGRRCVGERR